MLSALVVVVVLATEAQAPQTLSMARALQSALEPGSVVLVREASSAPDDEDLDAVAGPLHADAVVSVTWSEADARRAHLRVLRSGRPGPTDRNIDFKPSDASIERGRTVGFAIASMLPAGDTPPPPPPTPAVEDRPVEPGPTGDHDRAWGLDLLLASMVGVGGDAPGLGGDLGLRRWITASIDVRMAASLTTGRISAADASFTQARPRIGLGVEVLRRGSISAMLRLEAGAWLHAVESSGGRSSAGSRWVPGSSVSGELGWSLAPALSIVFALGADVAFGTTRVLVAEEERATIPPVRMTGEAGVRLHF